MSTTPADPAVPPGRLSILTVCAEFAPFAKVGGLGDVTAGLCAWLACRGHDIRVVLPCYGSMRAQGLHRGAPVLGPRYFTWGGIEHAYTVVPLSISAEGARLFLVDCPGLFGGDVYERGPGEAGRFILLSRAALELAAAQGFAPDIVHCHDWHAAPAAVMLSGPMRTERVFHRASSVLTIHNIGYQGVFDALVLDDAEALMPRQLFPLADLDLGLINFLRAGITAADALTTVSPTHALEIQTPAYGKGLDELLRQRRHRLAGILNGVDYSQWSPEADALLPQRFSAGDLSGKQAVRETLLRDLQLHADAGTPVIGLVSRLTEQKGIDLIIAALPALLASRNFVCALLGNGDVECAGALRDLARSHPGRVAFVDGYDETMAHRIIAGSDLLLVPSRYEPCGLTQLYALRYGTVPVVRHTGGLADTVSHFDPRTGEGTGSVFRDADVGGLSWGVTTALDWFADPEVWARVIQNGMRQDFSWDRQGPKYEELFARLL